MNLREKKRIDYKGEEYNGGEREKHIWKNRRQ